MLVDVSKRSTKTTILGTPIDLTARHGGKDCSLHASRSLHPACRTGRRTDTATFACPRRAASLDPPVPYSPPLEAAFLPSVARVVAAARELVEY